MNITDFIDKGGVIVYILIVINIIGFTIILSKVYCIFSMKNKQEKIVKTILNLINKNESSSDIDALISYQTKLNSFGVNTIRIIATISPLLGLLGTVVGILFAFDNIAKLGLDDPSVFSSNISLALTTTVAGLVVAIPHYIFYNYYIGVLQNNELEIYNKVISAKNEKK